MISDITLADCDEAYSVVASVDFWFAGQHFRVEALHDLKLDRYVASYYREESVLLGATEYPSRELRAWVSHDGP